MEFPEIKFGQYIVVQAELATGIILNLDGNRHLGSGEWYLIFNSLDEAKIYSNHKITEVPDVECNIYNHLSKFILNINSFKNNSFEAF